MSTKTSSSDALPLDAFVDGELDLERQLEVEAALARDSRLADEVEGLKALRTAVRTQADYHAAPPRLAARIEALARLPDQDRARVEMRPWRLRLAGWLDWRPMALSSALTAAFACALAVALWPVPSLEREAVASHVRSTLGTRLVDVPSSDQHTVKPWLSARLDFSPPVHDLAGAVSSFIGGRIDYFGGHPVAALVYRERDHVINAFIWPVREADKPFASDNLRGFNVVHWTKAGMAHCMVSDLNHAELMAIAQRLDAADAGR